MVLFQLFQGFLAGGRLGDDVNVRLRSKQGPESAADHEVVVHKEHRDGIHASS
jgi:hypothetical protein